MQPVKKFADRNGISLFEETMSHITRCARGSAAALALALLSGCAGFWERAWVPQGPGGRVGATFEDPKATKKDEVAAGGRSFQVAPELIAQAPPPRSGAAPATAGAPLSTAGGYTQSTRYGDLVFVSGQIAIDLQTNAFDEAANVEQQTRVVMENIRAILESHRLTMANVVSVTVYLNSLNNFRGMNTVYESYFKSNLPSRSVVEVARLPRNAAVEISVVAGR
jgi:2-iminobutanoate/2-iminopropanoate deaminase